jgi:hypothetical protein
MHGLCASGGVVFLRDGDGVLAVMPISPVAAATCARVRRGFPPTAAEFELAGRRLVVGEVTRSGVVGSVGRPRWSHSVGLLAKQTIFNLLACDYAHEATFAHLLDGPPDVGASAKLPTRFGFSIDLWTTRGACASGTPTQPTSQRREEDSLRGTGCRQRNDCEACFPVFERTMQTTWASALEQAPGGCNLVCGDQRSPHQ